MAATSSPGDDAAEIDKLKGKLYEAAVDTGSKTQLYSQSDLLDLDVIPNNDLTLLVRVIQRLQDDFLFNAVSDSKGIRWKWRAKDDAKKYRSLPTQEAAMVYLEIDEAGADGIWHRTLKQKLKMHDSVLKQAIKVLENRKYIGDLKSVEYPSRKMYIRANLRPSEKATGGPWYNETAELDEPFIASLERFIFEYVKTKSTYQSAHGGRGAVRQPTKGVLKGGIASGGSGAGGADKGKKRSATEMSSGENGAEAITSHHTQVSRPQPPKAVLLPMPVGYKKYPTVREIAKLIADSGITTNTTLSEPEVQTLVDILVYDGLLEEVIVAGRKGYRVARAHKQDPSSLEGASEETAEPRLGGQIATNGLMEAPCGRCPVFELCEPGGPVSPNNCVYFDRWLGKD